MMLFIYVGNVCSNWTHCCVRVPGQVGDGAVSAFALSDRFSVHRWTLTERSDSDGSYSVWARLGPMQILGDGSLAGVERREPLP